jgi:hypothetical protein
MPETWIFWDRREALDWVESTTYPKVFKLAIGGGAKNVALVASSSEAKRLVSAMFEPGIVPGQVESFVGKKNGSAGTRLRLFSSRCRRAVNYVLYSRSPNLAQPEKGYVYFQEYIPNNQFTNSISIVGNRAFSSCSFNRSNDFRAFGDIVHTDHSAVSRDCIRLAFEISSSKILAVKNAGDIPCNRGQCRVQQRKPKLMCFCKVSRNHKESRSTIEPVKPSIEVMTEIGIKWHMVAGLPGVTRHSQSANA